MVVECQRVEVTGTEHSGGGGECRALLSDPLMENSEFRIPTPLHVHMALRNGTSGPHGEKREKRKEKMGGNYRGGTSRTTELAGR